MTDLSVTRGDDEIIDIVITDLDTGDPVNLSSVDIWMTVKVHKSDPDSLALILKETGGSGITVTNPTDGEAVIEIANTDTRPFPESWSGFYDVQIKSGSGDIKTVAQGAFEIVGDVTWQTS